MTSQLSDYLQELNWGAAGGGLLDPPNPADPKEGVDPEAMEPKVGPLPVDADPNCPKAPPLLEDDISGFWPKAGGEPKGWPDNYLINNFKLNIFQYFPILPPKLGAPPKAAGLVGVFCCWTAKPEDPTFPPEENPPPDNFPDFY